MNKTFLVHEIIACLGEKLTLLEKAAQASHAEATHESSRAESKYDTRGLEAAYLAGGQARQAKEIIDSIKLYQSLAIRNFGPGDTIDLSAVVELKTDGAKAFYFIGPKNGGLEINFNGDEITVLTPHSPLGQNLVGKKSGESWTIKSGAATTRYQIVKVW